MTKQKPGSFVRVKNLKGRGFIFTSAQFIITNCACQNGQSNFVCFLFGSCFNFKKDTFASNNPSRKH